MKIKIEIKHYLTGKILFELEKENNTLVDTIREASLLTDLYGADLLGTDLSGSDLSGAILRGSNLHRANLRGSDLSGSDLRGSDLSGSDLRGTDLYGAILRGTNLYGADLREASLRGADLRGSNLHGSNLLGTDLSGSDLRGANLRGAKNAELAQAYTYIVPEGSIIGWKLCRDNILVKLRIPEEAKRSNATGRKCRAEFADVLEMINLNDEQKQITEAVSLYDDTFKYVVGERVVPKEPWDDDRWEECASGIHFYITRIEAENHA